MKLITAMVQPHKVEDVKQALFKAGVTKMTVLNAMGCGQQKGYDENYRCAVHTVNLLRKVVFEIAVNEDYVEPTIKAVIEGARTGKIGDGKIFVTELKEVIRIRTGERGKEAIG